MSFNDNNYFSVFSLQNTDLKKNKKVNQRIYSVYPHKDEKDRYEYKVLNYDTTAFCFDEPMSTRQCRSVILSHPENYLLSFSPPKPISFDQFQEKYKELSHEIYVNEMIEGTLLHFFYDDRMKSWEIATKRAVGGIYHLFHYKNKIGIPKKTKLRNLFLDALHIPRDMQFNDIRMFDSFSKDYSYCFILQHPENRILLPIDTPALFLIAVYSILPISTIAISIPAMEYEQWECLQHSGLNIQFPKNHVSNIKNTDTFDGFYDYKIKYESTDDYSSMGIVMTNIKDGEYCVIRNTKYDKITKWNQKNILKPPLQFQYLSLQRIGKIFDFLAYFPRYKSNVNAFFKDYNEFVKEIHEYYMAKYVFKTVDNTPEKFTYFVDAIHRELYIANFLNPVLVKKYKITRQIVFEYFNKLEPEHLLYILNYDRRQYL